MLIAFDGERPLVDPTAWIAPGAVLIGRVVVEAGATVMFNCVIRADNNLVRIGQEANIQDGSVIHCDPPSLSRGKPVLVGRRASIGHGARLHGCTIGEGAMVGIGAVVLDGAVIGDRCLVGAGALVLPGTETPRGHLIVGQPAHPKRPLRESDFAMLETASQAYVELRTRYRSSLCTGLWEGGNGDGIAPSLRHAKPYW